MFLSKNIWSNLRLHFCLLLLWSEPMIRKRFCSCSRKTFCMKANNGLLSDNRVCDIFDTWSSTTQELYRPAGAARGKTIQHPELHDDVHLRLDHQHRVQDEAFWSLANGKVSKKAPDMIMAFRSVPGGLQWVQGDHGIPVSRDLGGGVPAAGGHRQEHKDLGHGLWTWQCGIYCRNPF